MRRAHLRLPKQLVFDSSRFQATRQPLDTARTLPGYVFSSSAWHEKELSNLLTPNWVLAGRADELQQPGSFMKMDMPSGASALLVRSKDNSIKAWANVCTHRKQPRLEVDFVAPMYPSYPLSTHARRRRGVDA